MHRSLTAAIFFTGFAFAAGVKVRFDPSSPAAGPFPADALIARRSIPWSRTKYGPPACER